MYQQTLGIKKKKERKKNLAIKGHFNSMQNTLLTGNLNRKQTKK